jgi:hypothetical protein
MKPKQLSMQFVKMRGKRGKMIYASQVRQTERRMQENKSDGSVDFWADWKPVRSVGVWANGSCHTYKHNGNICHL